MYDADMNYVTLFPHQEELRQLAKSERLAR
jgi:hypothetical protein